MFNTVAGKETWNAKHKKCEEDYTVADPIGTLF